MYKHYIFLTIIFSLFFVNAMDNDPKSTQSANSAYGLIRYVNKKLPTEDDIHFYEELYGKLPSAIRTFYLNFGNCAQDGLDILFIYDKKNSGLKMATEFIREYINDYHAFAFDNVAGGYWVYTTKTYPKIEFFNTSHRRLTGESHNGFLSLLKKKHNDYLSLL